MVEQEDIGLSNIIDTISISFIKDPMNKEVGYLIKGKHYRSQKLWEATETDLEKILGDASIEEVEVIGVCTSICVMYTVGGLANRDYNVSVPVKGVADFDQEMHEFSLKRMKQLYGARVS